MKPSKQDVNDMYLAHKYRLSLTSSPSQSSFRVLALLFFEELDASPKVSQLPPWVPQRGHDGRTYIVGTNDEPGYIGGAICAERAAMVQLRFLPKFQITKVVIATDSFEPISPGLLCREFLAGHDSVPWDVTVLSSGCACRDCGLRDGALFDDVQEGTATSCMCATTGEMHNIPMLSTTIRELYPYPSPYTRLKTASMSADLGSLYSESFATLDMEALHEKGTAKRLLELAILEAKSHISDLHPISFGAAVEFKDGTIVTSHQSSALEYGCTLDAVSQLASHFQESSPVLLVQADQYGIAHAPFAPARAFLTEQGYGYLSVLLHQVPLDNESCLNDWKLVEIQVDKLAPNAPTWTESTEREASSSL